MACYYWCWLRITHYIALVWWRINAWAEIWAIGVALITAALLQLTSVGYELSLLYIVLSSAIGIVIGISFHPPTDKQTLKGICYQSSSYWCLGRISRKRSEKHNSTNDKPMARITHRNYNPTTSYSLVNFL